MARKADKKVNISFVILFALTTSSLVYDCQSESIEDHRLLHRSLLDEKYDPLLRPSNDTSYPVNVGFRFTPIIALLNEVSQELTLRGILVLTWEDFRLRWDPWEHNYINETDIPMLRSEDLQIWIPELVLNESLQTDYATFQPESYIARLYSTGQVYWLTLAGTKTFCGINVRYFPFDKQRCFLTFSTWAYHNGEQMFYSIDNYIEDEDYKRFTVRHGLWDVETSNVENGNTSYDCLPCADEEHSYVTYTIDLTRRQNTANFLNLILPCLVMSAMTFLVIFLPHGNGADTAAFGLTCILTLMVFVTYLFTSLPTTGQPILGGYIVWLIVEGVLITLYAVCDSHHNKHVEKSKLTTKTRDKNEKKKNSVESFSNIIDEEEEEEENDNDDDQQIPDTRTSNICKLPDSEIGSSTIDDRLHEANELQERINEGASAQTSDEAGKVRAPKYQSDAKMDDSSNKLPETQDKGGNYYTITAFFKRSLWPQKKPLWINIMRTIMILIKFVSTLVYIFIFGYINTLQLNYKY